MNLKCLFSPDAFIPNTIDEIWGDVFGGLTGEIRVHIEVDSKIKDLIETSSKVIYIEDYTA